MKRAIKTSIITTLVAGNVAIVSFSPALTFAKDRASELISHRPSITIEAKKFINIDRFKNNKHERREKAEVAFENLASWIGIDKSEFFRQWKENETIAKVVEDNGKSANDLERYLINESEERINKALQEGRITEEMAKRMKEKREDKLQFLLYQARAPRKL